MMYGYDKSKGYCIVGEGGAGSGNHGHGGRPGLRGGSSNKKTSKGGGSFDGKLDDDFLKQCNKIVPNIDSDYLSKTLINGKDFLNKIYNDDLSKGKSDKLYEKYCTKEEVTIIKQISKNWYDGGNKGIYDLRKDMYNSGMTDINPRKPPAFNKKSSRYIDNKTTKEEKANALMKMYIVNQKYLSDCGVNEVIAYRGVGTKRKTDIDISKATGYEFSSVESWSTDLQTGISFAMNKNNGVIIKERFKRSEVLFVDKTTPSNYGEDEIAICPNKTALKFTDKNIYKMNFTKLDKDVLHKNTKDAINTIGKKPKNGEKIDVIVNGKELKGMIVVNSKSNIGSRIKLKYPDTNKYVYVDQDDITGMGFTWAGWK